MFFAFTIFIVEKERGKKKSQAGKMKVMLFFWINMSNIANVSPPSLHRRGYTTMHTTGSTQLRAVVLATVVAVCAAWGTPPAMFIYCRTDADCWVFGDKGATCNPDLTCTCSAGVRVGNTPMCIMDTVITPRGVPTVNVRVDLVWGDEATCSTPSTTNGAVQAAVASAARVAAGYVQVVSVDCASAQAIAQGVQLVDVPNFSSSEIHRLLKQPQLPGPAIAVSLTPLLPAVSLPCSGEYCSARYMVGAAPYFLIYPSTLHAYAPDGSVVAVVTHDAGLRLLSTDPTNPSNNRVFLTKVVPMCIAFSHDSRYVATGGMERGTVWLWDTHDPSLTAWWDAVELSVGNNDYYARNALCVAFSPDGVLLAAGFIGGKVILWDYKKRVIYDSYVIEVTDVWTLEFTSDGTYVVSGSANVDKDTVKQYNVRTKTLVATQPDNIGNQLPGQWAKDHFVMDLVVSPDNIVASGRADGDVALWNLSSPDTVPIAIDAHDGYVYSVSFSSDGRLLASGGETTVSIWSTDTWARLLDLPHDTPVWGVTFSPVDNTVLVSSGGDTLQFWKLPTL